MAYRHDPDLEFLSTLSAEELNELVYLLTHDKDGSKRLTENLTYTEKYKKYHPQHHEYWDEIAGELQLFGGNTMVNLLFRQGRGVLYKEILCDVCDRMKVNYSKYSSTQQIEQNLLMKILQNALEKMSPTEISELGKELGLENVDLLNGPPLIAVFQAIFKAGGFKSYQLTLIIVNAVLKALIGRGLGLAGNAGLMRIMAILTGPVGFIITGVLTAVDIAGTAYRVTIPAVIQIIYLRALSENRNTVRASE